MFVEVFPLVLHFLKLSLQLEPLMVYKTSSSHLRKKGNECINLVTLINIPDKRSYLLQGK